MSGPDPLTSDERAYFDSKASDHDMLIKLSQFVWGKEIGLATHVMQNTAILLGDGTKENVGLVSSFYEHVREQEQNEKKRYRNLQFLIALCGVLIVLADRVLTWMFPH
jgi:hypothetical protein